MAMNNPVPVSEVISLRSQGMTDNLIVNELMRKGYDPDQVQMALSQAGDASSDNDFGPSSASSQSGYASGSGYGRSSPAISSNRAGEDGNVYERIEQITESLIDEKWDELISEVKKIVEWKEKMEEKQVRMDSDLAKLKDDFVLLHQGVLGKLEDYDTKMRDVGTQLNAVGKVFKDVVPTFVENVKELSSLTDKMKGK